ncbi:DUF4082 domain-containing protein [Solirubrobacter pauli]|uniref:DUF4082 domain-containing protein n=1 Tax=Solirubrobacter pauli TaxID=166793 RepID=UPI000EAC93D6|nr:DUF4082 domain-containing protein [Solirubrobacter pauli]
MAVAAAVVLLAAYSTTDALAACANPVACENALQGTPQENWYNARESEAIQGFATQMSVNKGQTIDFKIKSELASYTIDVLRLGYYDGDGARMMRENLPHNATATTQPSCKTFGTGTAQANTGLIDCGNWAVTASWQVPTDAVSGVYIAHLVDAEGRGSRIIFVVRDDARSSAVVVQTSDATWQAYNTYGGNSLYTCSVECPDGTPLSYKAAYKVSYNRPLITEDQSALFTGAEYSLIRFLEQNGYDASYISGVDTEVRGNELLDHRLFISSGHDEYWSATQRTNMEQARDAGVNMAFLTGNEGFWKTRYEPSADGSNTPARTLVSYKDTHFPAQVDPVSWTGTWRDPRYTLAGAGVTPENALTGQSFIVNSGTSEITVPYAFRNLRQWRNTDVANLTQSTQSVTLGDDTLGYEWDEDPDNGFRPAGAFRFSATTVPNVEVFTDFGSTTKFGQTATHNMTMYKTASGARVWGSGTVQWAWGLSEWNGTGANPDRNMQQATVNIFADMDAQATTRIPTLSAATKTTDTSAPTATVSVASTVSDGSVVTITGTATDSGGGTVAGVEVSTDGGATWHPATTGTTSWTYRWVAHGSPTSTIKARATDDSGNIGAATAGTNVTVTCPCSMWGTNVTPAATSVDSGDAAPIEVGVKFRASVLGTVSGIRFYKGAANTGTHVGSLWDANGQILANATFQSESASGWQSVTFSSPVTIQPNTTYIASYHAPNGHYSATRDYFWRINSPGPSGGGTYGAPPLQALKATGTTQVNGVFAYSGGPTFPDQSYAAANYWVDVSFTPTPAPGQVTNVVATSGGRTSANLTWTPPASGGTVSSFKITPYIGANAQAPITVPADGDSHATVTGLTTGTTYTFRVQAVNYNGTGLASPASNAVTPLVPVAPASPSGVVARPATKSALVTWTPAATDGDSAITGQTVTPYDGAVAQTPIAVGPSATSVTVPGLTNGTAYTFRVSATNAVGASPQSAASAPATPQSTLFDFATPTTVDAGDPWSAEYGVKFKPEHDGKVTGVRFYKSAANTGTHIGSLWQLDGTKLSSATFTNETASGWQSVTFATPIDVTAGTTYIASYFTPSGHPSVTSGAFASALENGPLEGIATSESANGLYLYTSSSTAPTQSFNGTSYGVDVLFALPRPGQVTDVSADESGRTSATVQWTAPTGDGPVESYRVTPYVGANAQTPKTVPASATSTTVTGLTTGTTYTFRVQAVNANGAGPASDPSNAVTPSVPVPPSAPTNVVARPATGSAQLSWALATGDGDSPITGQTVTPYVGAVAQTPIEVGPSATSLTVNDLTNGTAYTFRVSATNGVGTGPQSAASASVTPQTTLFDFGTPAIIDADDPWAGEYGIKFKPKHDGWVTGVRFYKAAANTGTHIGSLWNAAGSKITSATFTNETATGWQSVTFPSPIAVTAGTTYVASYFTPTGHPSVTSGARSSVVSNGALESIANATSPNGLYVYSATSTFPTLSYAATDYGVDVMFALPQPGQPTAVTAQAAGRTSVIVDWTPPASGGPVETYKVIPYVGSTPQTAKTVTGPTSDTTITGLTSGTTYTFRVQAVNANGTGPLSAASGSVTPDQPVVPTAPTGVGVRPATQSVRVSWTPSDHDGDSAITGQTVTPYIGATAQTPVQVSAAATAVTIDGLTNGTAYTFRVTATNGVGTSPQSTASASVTPQSTLFDFDVPQTVDAGDAWPAEYGVKFKPKHDGWVTGIRFYKSAANTGTHTGSLWNAAGDRIGNATFTNESATGWQSVTFASPVQVTAGTTYVASYFTPTGHPSITAGAFTLPVDRGPLQTIANSVSANGLFLYSATSALPTQSFNATHYGVDVLFAMTLPGQVTGVTATAGQRSATVSWTAPSGGGVVTQYKVTPYIGANAQTPTTVTAPSTSTTMTGLTAGTAYTFRVQAINPGGVGPVSAASSAVTPTAPTAPAVPSGVTATGDSKAAIVRWTAPADGGSAITGYTITPYIGAAAQTPVNAGASATSARISGLTNHTAYTFRVSATNAIGTGTASAATAAVTPRASLFEGATPGGSLDSGDTDSIVVGVKFTAEVDGFVTGVRFYKSAANTGTHIGSLWTADGQHRASAPFTNETATGWQAVTFPTPVAVTAGTVYVVSYLAPNGHYSAIGSGFATAGVDNAPLHALASTTSPNGVYAYSATSVFPSEMYNSTNYSVDVLFAPGA